MAPIGAAADDDEFLDLGGLGGAVESSGRSAPCCLVGKLITEKSANVFALIDVMKKGFRPKGKLQARD